MTEQEIEAMADLALSGVSFQIRTNAVNQLASALKSLIADGERLDHIEKHGEVIGGVMTFEWTEGQPLRPQIDESIEQWKRIDERRVQA